MASSQHLPLCILHTESSKGWGGQENRTLNEMIGMRERGHRCLLVCQTGAILGDRAREAGFTVFETRMRSAGDFPAIFRLRRFIAEQRPDIVNTHSGRDTQIACLAAHSLLGWRPRLVRTRHLALPITSHFTYSTLPDHVVTVSSYVENYLTSAGIPRECISTVPTGIELSRYSATLPTYSSFRRELGLSHDALLIGTVAILRAKKGHSDILDAVPTVLLRFPNAHFVFVGDGPQMENLRSRIENEQLGQHVHLLGLRHDVIPILAALDVFLLPTHQEALGTAFIEAGAMGLPSIGTRVGGVPEVIQDGKTGLLVPAHDSAAIAEAVCTLLADPALRKRLGSEAKALVHKKFSREAMVEGMERVYRLLLKPQ